MRETEDLGPDLGQGKVVLARVVQMEIRRKREDAGVAALPLLLIAVGKQREERDRARLPRRVAVRLAVNVRIRRRKVTLRSRRRRIRCRRREVIGARRTRPGMIVTRTETEIGSRLGDDVLLRLPRGAGAAPPPHRARHVAPRAARVIGNEPVIVLASARDNASASSGRERGRGLRDRRKERDRSSASVRRDVSVRRKEKRRGSGSASEKRRRRIRLADGNTRVRPNRTSAGPALEVRTRGNLAGLGAMTETKIGARSLEVRQTGPGVTTRERNRGARTGNGLVVRWTLEEDREVQTLGKGREVRTRENVLEAMTGERSLEVRRILESGLREVRIRESGLLEVRIRESAPNLRHRPDLLNETSLHARGPVHPPRQAKARIKPFPKSGPPHLLILRLRILIRIRPALPHLR
uniref:Uncharacterized protein n=1 Tax=Cacopsylla melanoneura TaxID=428564 RepID=A0A8D8QXT1_9HEMI